MIADLYVTIPQRHAWTRLYLLSYMQCMHPRFSRETRPLCIKTVTRSKRFPTERCHPDSVKSVWMLM